MGCVASAGPGPCEICTHAYICVYIYMYVYLCMFVCMQDQLLLSYTALNFHFTNTSHILESIPPSGHPGEGPYRGENDESDILKSVPPFRHPGVLVHICILCISCLFMNRIFWATILASPLASIDVDAIAPCLPSHDTQQKVSRTNLG